jgi:pectin methylesterase-like acyl-CoA thioesterase
MSKLAWSPALAAALLLSACATVEPVAQARDETGVVVATRPIVAVNTDVSATPASTSTPASATAQLPTTGAVQAPPGALTTPTPPPNVRVLIIADAVGPGETQHGVSYTIRRDRDGTLFEVAQPETTALAKGTKVKIGYTDKVRITPAS